MIKPGCSLESTLLTPRLRVSENAQFRPVRLIPGQAVKDRLRRKPLRLPVGVTTSCSSRACKINKKRGVRKEILKAAVGE